MWPFNNKLANSTRPSLPVASTSDDVAGTAAKTYHQGRSFSLCNCLGYAWARLKAWPAERARTRTVTKLDQTCNQIRDLRAQLLCIDQLTQKTSDFATKCQQHPNLPDGAIIFEPGYRDIAKRAAQIHKTPDEITQQLNKLKRKARDLQEQFNQLNVTSKQRTTFYMPTREQMKAKKYRAICEELRNIKTQAGDDGHYKDLLNGLSAQVEAFRTEKEVILPILYRPSRGLVSHIRELETQSAALQRQIKQANNKLKPGLQTQLALIEAQRLAQKTVQQNLVDDIAELESTPYSSSVRSVILANASAKPISPEDLEDERVTEQKANGQALAESLAQFATTTTLSQISVYSPPKQQHMSPVNGVDGKHSTVVRSTAEASQPAAANSLVARARVDLAELERTLEKQRHTSVEWLVP